MTPHRDWFYTYEPVLEGYVSMGNDHALEIVRVGTIKIKMFYGYVCTLQGVRHVKGLKFVKGALMVIKVEKIVTNLYMLIRDTLQEVEALAASASQDEMTMMWHKKLGQCQNAV